MYQRCLCISFRYLTMQYKYSALRKISNTDDANIQMQSANAVIHQAYLLCSTCPLVFIIYVQYSEYIYYENLVILDVRSGLFLLLMPLKNSTYQNLTLVLEFFLSNCNMKIHNWKIIMHTKFFMVQQVPSEKSRQTVSWKMFKLYNIVILIRKGRFKLRNLLGILFHKNGINVQSIFQNWDHYNRHLENLIFLG